MGAVQKNQTTSPSQVVEHHPEVIEIPPLTPLVSGDSENWSGGDTKTGPPCGANHQEFAEKPAHPCENGASAYPVMRGQQECSGSLFSYVTIEERIPASHPLRRIRKLADQALDRLNPTFCKLYASEGRPSVPPEQLLLASLLQAFCGIRSERLLLEQLHYNLLFRWFVGLSPDDPIWHPTTFTKNRERLLNEQIMGRFLEKLMGAPEVKPC